MHKKTILPIQTLAILCAGLFLCGFEFAPNKWIDNIPKLWQRDEPCVKDVQFWDFEREEFRGVRAFFYTLPLERENRLIDARLNEKMFHFLSLICNEVITIDAFENSLDKLLFEKRLDQLATDWKLRGKINPAILSEPIITTSNASFSLDFDILVFIERTHYDQSWKDNKKSLVVGISAAAFEMDYGSPVYQDRVLAEFPWTGVDDTCAKVEHATLLRVADDMGIAIQKKAGYINQEHQRLENEKLLASIEQQTEQSNAIKNETRELRSLYDIAQKRIKAEPIPADLIPSLTETLDTLKPLLQKRPPKIITANKPIDPNQKPPKDQLTANDMEMRRQLAQAIRDDLKTWDELKQQDELKKQAVPPPSLRQESANSAPLPGETMKKTEKAPKKLPTENMVGVPQVNTQKQNLFNRDWLRPSNASIKPGTVPIVPTNGTIIRPEIPSSSIPEEIPNSFQPFQQQIPAQPDASKSTGEKSTEATAAQK